MAFTTLTASNNHLNVILFLTVTSTLFGDIASWNPRDVIGDSSDPTRWEVEKDVLKHSITYLKSKLVKCLRESDHQRHKRKLHLHTEDYLTYQVDMEVLLNTKEYLIERVVQCHHRGSQAPNDVILGNSAPGEDRQYDQNPRHRLNAKSISATTTTRSSLASSSGVQPTNAPIAAQPKSWGKPKTFTIAGRRVSCDSLEIAGNRATLTCRNLLVDGKHRLPNYDVCPETAFNQLWWRHLNEIQQRTFDVLDLKSFCTALGTVSAIPLPVLDVKVNWSCDETKHRLKWLNGKWAGQVDDNGFLHDIQCVFYTSNA